ncbi:MAG TPA: hypothetical protein VII56_20305 [Rhizomicrobium sp.]
MKRALILAASIAALAMPAAAQSGHYAVQTINFDLWCQETQHLPADRCDKRLPGDEADFEDYRAKVEKFEVPYLQDKESGAQLSRTILHADPVDHPVTQDPAAASQQPTSPANHP